MAIVAIARGFGLHLLAEGVESKVQMEALQALGCDEMQGFFFSPPLPIAEINRFLSGKPRDTHLH
jgi:EAL domain-containing protein (putative c-di-GMP-specific phosphodiesterase class I)